MLIEVLFFDEGGVVILTCDTFFEDTVVRVIFMAQSLAVDLIISQMVIPTPSVVLDIALSICKQRDIIN